MLDSGGRSQASDGTILWDGVLINDDVGVCVMLSIRARIITITFGVKDNLIAETFSGSGAK